MGIDGPLERVRRDADPGVPEGSVGVDGSSASSASLADDDAHRNMELGEMGMSQNAATDFQLGEKLSNVI